MSGAWDPHRQRLHRDLLPRPAASRPCTLDGTTRRVGSTSWLEVTTKVRTSATGIAGLVFDGYAANDYKFAGIDIAGQRVVIGHFDPRRGWVVDASYAKALTAGTVYTLSITLKGASVSVSVNGGFVGSTGFNAGVVDGRFGLMAFKDSATFTSVRVRTDDAAFAGAALWSSSLRSPTSAARCASSKATVAPRRGRSR